MFGVPTINRVFLLCSTSAVVGVNFTSTAHVHLGINLSQNICNIIQNLSIRLLELKTLRLIHNNLIRHRAHGVDSLV